MLVQEREKAWNGAEKALGSATFKAGKEYSFSVNAISLEGTNTNYKIPDGATDMKMYVKTESGMDNFYIDEAIVAIAGKKIDGPQGKQPALGDVDLNGTVDVFDLVAARQGIVSGSFPTTAALLAADVDKNGKADVNDLSLIQDYILGKIRSFA